MTKATTESHKFAKVGKNFFVLSKQGWMDGTGKVVPLSASPKQTLFLTEADAKSMGFVATATQTAALTPTPPTK